MEKLMDKALNIIFTVVGLIILAVLILYAREGRLSFQTLRGDFVEAVNLKKERIEEQINYNAVSYEDFITKLKRRGLVVGEVKEIGSNNLGAKIAVKFTVEGKTMYFYNIDWDDETNPDIKATIEALEADGKVFIDGKKYKALINDTAMIARYEENDAFDTIVEEFEKIIPISYDEMITERNKGNNSAANAVDNILDNIEASR